jgi:acetoacetyl-CoA reductase/3-oxoacyl-[acyl-carrier protein] reductase
MKSFTSIVITGASSGIGEATARRLAREPSASPVLVARREQRLRELAAELGPERVSYLAVDLLDDDAPARIREHVLERHGRLDLLVNNAGVTIDRTVAKMTDDEWATVLAVNLSGAFFTAQAALAHMLERGSGRIVNISSIIGEQGNVGQANYAASKSGLFGLTKSLAREAAFQLQRAGKLEPDGLNVTVNCVAPGFIATEMVDAVPEKALARITAQIPLGRLGRADEVARVVRFLCSDDSAYITGQIWHINGGQEM